MRLSWVVTLLIAAVVVSGYNTGSRHLLEHDDKHSDMCLPAIGFEKYVKCKASSFWGNGNSCSDQADCLTPVSSCARINDSASKLETYLHQFSHLNYIQI